MVSSLTPIPSHKFDKIKLCLLSPPIKSTMSVLPPIFNKEFSGHFSSDGPPPSFPNPKNHPLLKLISGTVNVLICIEL